MCIGIPMQVVALESLRALCTADAETRWVDIRLIDVPQIGDWLLVFLDSAREILTPERAGQIQEALLALQAASRGDFEALSRCFADLNREPELPEHLRPFPAGGSR
ncbi:hydrogenase expression/formation protein HypC [Azomonas agilis]|uniref:Hydrogenase expression/formation protein HypC n=1 Tax=Azomonas agilis TaxID=116849 RepID=A0A562J0B3_9GAMM|nr:HypC/HybG/HupF family hydrogenase formation chaperone [Azomonas agilis]TWH76602.1 hydrogenase expression/formation protein HypC [Azomonas agilis]